MLLREAIARDVANRALGVSFDKSSVDRRNYLDVSDLILKVVERWLRHNGHNKAADALNDEHMP